MPDDYDLFHVVFLRRCPWCGDKLEREVWKKVTYYRHAEYRGWCYHTNFVYGKFYMRQGTLELNEGIPGGNL